MGLSVSQSAAERQRVEQLSLKQLRSANRSQSKSQDRSKHSVINDDRIALSHEPSSHQLKLPQPVNNMKNKLKQDENANFGQQHDMRHSADKTPKIAVIPPSEKKRTYFEDKLEKVETPKAEKTKQLETINHDDIIPRPYLQKVEAQQVYVIPIIDQKESLPEPKVIKEQTLSKVGIQTPNKIGVQNLTEKVSPARITRPEANQSLLLSSGSRTLNLKKALPTLDSDPTFTGEPHHANLQVEFQNFDWEIPRASKEGASSSPPKKLKPESSVVLISKFGKEEQEVPQKSGQKRKWKTRRDLMNEIVNDRLDSADGDFFLPQCLPNGSSGYESIQQICS